MWTDSHCHVPYEGLEDAAAVVSEARDAGVGRLVTIGTDVAGSRAAIAVARAHPEVRATAGVHPHEAEIGRAHV